MGLPSYLGGNGKIEKKTETKANKKNLPSYLNPVLKSDAVGYDGLRNVKTIDNFATEKVETPSYLSKPEVKKNFLGRAADSVDNFFAKIRNSGIEDTKAFKTVTAPVDALYKVPLTQRALVTAGNTIGGEGAVMNKDGTPMERLNAGKVGNVAADLIGTGIGYSMPMAGVGHGASTSSLQNVSNDITRKLTDKLPDLASKFISKTPLPSYLPNTALKVADYGANALKQGLEFGTLNGIQGLAQGKSIGESVNSGLEGLKQGAIFGTALKGLGEVSKSAFPKWQTTFESKAPIEEPKPIKEVAVTKPIEPIKGKFTVKNTALEKAQQEYDDAIETIHNHFMTNKLTPEEVARVKPELGIDLDKLTRNIETAKTDVRSIAENQRMAKVAGVNELPTNKLQQPILKPVNSVIEPLKTKSSVITPKAIKVPKNQVIEPLKVTNEPIFNNETPATIKGGTKNRQFIENSLLNSEIATPEMKAKFKKNLPEYEPITNKKTWEGAVSKVESDYKTSLDNYWSSKELKSAEDTALGEALISKSIKDGNIDLANKLSTDLAEKLTTAGQTVQAAAMFKRLTPEGMLMYSQNVVKRVNKDLVKEFGNKAKKVELTTEESKKILDIMKKVQEMPEGDTKNVELAKVMSVINNKVPSSLVDKIRSYRNIALLANPKTFTRNIVGNTLMGAFDNVSNTVGATLLKPLDNLLSKKTGIKTVALPDLKIQGQGFLKGGKTAIQDSLGGLTKEELKTKLKELKGKNIKDKYNSLMELFTNPIDRDLVSNGKFETGKKLAFENKPMKLLENITNTSLAIGDKPYSQAYYDDLINQFKKSNKISEVTNEMKQIAEKVASERTYQDMNTISNLASLFKRLPQAAANHPKLEKALKIYFDSIMPYTKTPANILKRGLEATPVGIVEGLAKIGSAFKNDNLTAEMQREIIDRISRGLVGSGLMVGGVALANKGKITGAANKDKDVAAFERQIGKQPYAIKLPNDKYYNYDWMQPVSMPLGAAAQVVNAKKEGSDNLTAIADAVSNALNYYADQPMLQSVQRLVGSANDTKGIGQRVIDSALELPKQFVPSVLKQSAQLKDNTQRQTYSPNYLENNLINPIKAKIPGQSNKLEPKIDTLGNETKQFQGNNNLFNVAVNPGYLTKDMSTSVTDMIMDVYNKTGDKTIFPKVADKTIQYKGEPYKLTPKEYTEFQKYIGTETNLKFKSISNDKLFKIQSPENQAKELQKALNKIYDEGKKKILQGRGVK